MDISVKRFKDIIGRFGERQIAVFGDIVADLYIYGKPLRLSREAPVLVVRHEGETLLPGSAGNTISNLSRLGVRVFPIGILGDDDPGRSLLSQFSRMNVEMEGLFVVGNRRTITKTRILAGDDHTSKQQVIRIDREVQESLPRETEDRLAAYLDQIRDRVDALIVADYGYDLVNPVLLEKLKAMAEQKTVIVDSRYRLHLFTGVTAITPNESEAETISQQKIMTNGDAARVGQKLIEDLDLKAVLITRGNKGMVLVERPGDVFEIPICGSDEITDVTGAGDTVAAVFTASLAAGASFNEASHLSNYGASVVVMKSGTATVSQEELNRAVEQDLTPSR
jgi:rfaE bifunctional protein kinase chain/domain